MSDCNEPNWNEIIIVLDLLLNHLKSNLDEKKVKIIEHYITVGEYEMAMEIILLLLSERCAYPQGLSKELLVKTVKELKLNSMSVWDDNFWDKFCKWVENFPEEK